MNSHDIEMGADENCILQYLNNFKDTFITETEITRRADGRNRFVEDSHWAHNALNRLMEWQLVEMDGEGKFRLKSNRTPSKNTAKKFMSPKMREILERSGHKIDLSDFT